MPIVYKIDVIEALKRKGFISSKLKADGVLPGGSVTSLQHGRPVNFSTLSRVCEMLSCSLDDVVAFVSFNAIMYLFGLYDRADVDQSEADEAERAKDFFFSKEIQKYKEIALAAKEAGEECSFDVKDAFESIREIMSGQTPYKSLRPSEKDVNDFVARYMSDSVLSDDAREILERTWADERLCKILLEYKDSYYNKVKSDGVLMFSLPEGVTPRESHPVTVRPLSDAELASRPTFELVEGQIVEAVTESGEKIRFRLSKAD